MKELIPAAVYLLCMATSGLCALLLARAWRKTRAPLLLWTAGCFVLLTINNVLLVVDLLLLPQLDLSPYRTLSALAAVSVLLFGFIRET
jgi:hypothetical protein